MRVLIETKDLSKDVWLEYRKKGIGGSDASAVAGVNKYKSPIALYMEKTGVYTPSEPGEAAYWGNTLEDIVAQEFIKRYNEELAIKNPDFCGENGRKARIQKRNAILMHDEYDFILANVDRMLFCPIKGKGVLEVKTASQYVADEWKGDDVPDAYYCQVQHMLGITGYAYAYIAVLIGGNDFRMYYIARDEAFINNLIKLECDFWINNVLASVPPEIDGSDSTKEMYKVLYPTDYKGKTIDLMADAILWAEGREEAKKRIEEWKTIQQENENKLKAAMGDASEAFAGFHKITWKANKNGVRSLLVKLEAVK